MAGALQIRRAEAATQLILNRPAKANALTFELVEDLIKAVETALRDGTRLLVLRGEGKNFCGGFDFSDFEQQSDGDLLHRFVRLELLLQALYHAPIATLALCHGGTYGAGADLVAACDRRVAAPDTTFRMPGLRFGIALGTRRLAHRIGADHALEILASSRVFDAQEARRIGLVGIISALDTWGDIVRDVATGLKLDAGAASLLKSRVQTDTRAADLAALVESAAAPGLKARIRAFRSAKG